jgi:hypothetical protein
MQKKEFFVVITPLDHEVTLYMRRWIIHIVRRHPELDGKIDDALNVLKNPEFIAFNRKYSTYNAVFQNIMVSYKLKDRSRGIVRTAMKIKKTYKKKLRRLKVWP